MLPSLPVSHGTVLRIQCRAPQYHNIISYLLSQIVSILMYLLCDKSTISNLYNIRAVGFIYFIYACLYRYPV